jgi:hypothetical protein
MKKNNILFFIFLLCIFSSFSQEEKGISNEELNKIFYSSNDFDNAFSDQNLKHFEIKSFDALGNQIPLCINEKLEIFLDCKSKEKYAQIINSIIYDLDMNKIGHCFLGKITKKDLDSFWDALKYWKGNITIYDKTESSRLATFMYFEKEKDYFAIMNLDSTSTVKMLNKTYRKLLKKYNISKFPDDEEIIAKNKELKEAYMVISKKIDPDYQDENNWLEYFFSKNRRGDWSQDEGYVPYTKRKRKDSKPISQEKNKRYPYLD